MSRGETQRTAPRRRGGKAPAGWVLAADLGGTKLAVARVSADGRLRDRHVVPTPPQGGGAVVAALIAALRQLPQADVRAVAIGVPGLAARDGHVWAPNLPGWERMPLARRVRRALRYPVLVESDRNAFVAGEAWRGAARGCRDVVLVMVGTGIGAGILSGGQLVRGHGELAGAVGWMALPVPRPAPGAGAAHAGVLASDYRRCGCLEAHAAGPGIARAAQRLYGAPDADSLGVPELVRRCRHGDRSAQALLAAAGEALGMGLANLVSTLNPEVIVMAGGVIGAGRWLLAPARAAMLRWGQPLAVGQVKVVRSRLGGSAGLLGAARLAWVQLGIAD